MKEKMKIVALEIHPETIGGGKTHLDGWSKALTELGNEVHVITSKPAKGVTIEFPKGVHVHHVGLRHRKFNGLWGLPYRALYELAFIFGAGNKLEDINPDIIDCQSSTTTALPATWSGRPFVITYHAVHTERMKDLYNVKGQATVSKYGGGLYGWMEEYNTKRAKALICQGKDTLNYYSKFNSKAKGFLLPHLIDTEFWNSEAVHGKAGSPSGQRNPGQMCAVARFTEQKALDKAVLAANQMPRLQLKLGGFGDLEGELRALAGPNTALLGQLTPEQCRDLYSKSRFFIISSIFEGLPYALLEAMSCGCIPIATRVGDIPAVIIDGYNGFLMEHNEPEDITHAIMRASEKNLDEMSMRARETIVKAFSPAKVAGKFVEAYKVAMGEKDL